jgi:hypothetical protein
MALSGKLEADFEDFYREAKKAEQSLKGLEVAGGTVGPTVDRNLRLVTSSATATTNVFGTMQKGLSQVDRTLAQFGVNLTPQVAALNELSAIAGKSATQLGALGTAGAVAAAALGGWQVGRWVADITGADQAIANLTARLLGLGDLAAETAAAKMDAVTLAIQRGAKETITYTEAVKYNTEWAKQHEAQLVSSAGHIREWNNEIGELGAAGRLKALRADLEGGAMTLEELSRKYGISKDAIDHWHQSIKASDESVKAAHKAIADLTAITDKLWGKDVIDRAGDYLGAITRVGGQLPTLKSGQEELVKVFGAAITAMEQTGHTGEAMYNTLIAKQNQLLGLTKDGLIPATHLGVDLWEGPTVAVEAYTQTFLDDTYTRIDAARNEAEWYEQFQTEQAELLKANDALLVEQAAQHTATGAAGVQAAQQMAGAYGQLGGTIASVGQSLQASQQMIDQWRDSMRAGGFIEHGSLAGGGIHNVGAGNMWENPSPIAWQAPQGGGVNVQVNASNSFYDTPEGVQRLAEKVGGSVMASLRAKGWNA